MITRPRSTRQFLLLLLTGLVMVGCGYPAYQNNKTISVGKQVPVAQSPATPQPTATPGAPEQQESEAPETIVSSFYDWYLAYFGDLTNGITRNPLVDAAYRDAPYLTPSFVEHIDQLLDEMRQQGGGGYDPILCAQDIPHFIEPEVTFSRNGMASVVIRSSFPNQRVTIDLVPHDESWLINNITCTLDPAGTAKTFYTWYLGSIGDRSADDFHNPLVEGAYHDHPLLTVDFEQRVDETLSSFDRGGYDPFLLAQDIPQDFTVDPGVAEGTAVVHLQFGPQSVKHILVTMDETGRRIADITEDKGLPNEAPVDDGAAIENSDPDPGQETNGPITVPLTSYTSSEYGFSFSYPGSWVLQPLELGGPGQPEDWPVLSAWLLMPPEVAENLASKNAPPDPNASIIVAPFNVELVVGDEHALARVYGDLNGETAVFNSHEATLLHRDPGYTHVIFAHPHRPETWIVFTDWATTFPGREAQGQVAGPIWEPLLHSLAFNE